jgi:hypothetical protein
MGGDASGPSEPRHARADGDDGGTAAPGSGSPRHARSPQRNLRLRLISAAIAVVLLAGVVAVYVAEHHDGSDSVTARGGASTTASSAPASSSSPRDPTTTAAPTTSLAATTTTTAPPEPAQITMLFAGDLLPHSPLVNQAARYGQATGKRYDFVPMLAPMQPVVSGADVAICHMETPVAPDQAHLTSYPVFGGPVELVDTAKAIGYDGCSNASNHALDKGRAGIATTLDRFDLDHLRHAGTARTAEEAAAITVYDVKGVKVAHLSYAYGFNGYKLPADAPWAANQIDPARIRADAAKARQQGADLVVVSLHWGNEYEKVPSQYQRDIAAQILPSPDIDLVVGCHAHVAQPIDLVSGTYVIWGMGNQLANQAQVPRSDGLTAIATAQRDPSGRWKVVGVQGVPTWIQPGTFRVLPVVRTLFDPSTPPALRDQLRASYDRTAATVLINHTPGVTISPRPN